MKIEELFHQHENIILNIKSRLYFLIDIEEELRAVTKNKAFKIKNDISYRTIMDTWDMLVIDLSSLGKGMYEKAGFFNQLKSNLDQLNTAAKNNAKKSVGGILRSNNSMSKEEIEMSSYISEMIQKAQQEKLSMLFPKLRDRNPRKINVQDIDDLKAKFKNIVQDVISDRDNNRAHRYQTLNNNMPIIPRLDFENLRKKFDAIEEILNGLRSISNQSTFEYSYMNLVNSREIANDFVHSVLWGTSKMQDISTGLNKELSSPHIGRLLYGWMVRNRFVEKIHQKHDQIVEKIKANQADPRNQNLDDFCFNDVHLEENK